MELETIIGRVYSVTSDSGCTVGFKGADGVVHQQKTVSADTETFFVAKSRLTVVSDDRAVVTVLPSGAAIGLSADGGLQFRVVDALPSEGKSGFVYLAPSASSESGDVFEEWLYVDGSWERFGRKIDLSPFATKSLLQSEIAAHADDIATLSAYGHVKKSSDTGTSLPAIGVNDAGQMMLNVRSQHSGFEMDGGLHVNTSTDTHPTAGDVTVPLIATNSAGELTGLAATDEQAGGVLLANGIYDNRVTSVPNTELVQTELSKKQDNRLVIPLEESGNVLGDNIYICDQGDSESLNWSALTVEDRFGTTAEIWLTTSDDPPEVSWPQDWVWRGTASDDEPPLLPGAKLCVFLLRRDAVGVTARLADVRGEERPYVQPMMTGFNTWSNTPSFGLKVSAFGAFGNDLSTTTNANGNTIYAWKCFTTVDNEYYLYFHPASLTDKGPRELVMEFERPLKITKFRWANRVTGSTGWFSYDILADGVIIISDRTHWHNGTTNLVDIPVPRLNQRYALTYTLRLMPYSSGWTRGIFQPYGMIHIVGVY